MKKFKATWKETVVYEFEGELTKDMDPDGDLDSIEEVLNNVFGFIKKEEYSEGIKLSTIKDLETGEEYEI